VGGGTTSRMSSGGTSGRRSGDTSWMPYTLEVDLAGDLALPLNLKPFI